MARSWSNYGPYMVYPSGADSPYRSYEENGFQTGASRKRPKDLIRNMTTLTATRYSRAGAYFVPKGYTGLYPTYIAGSVSASSARYGSQVSSAEAAAAAKLRARLKDQTWNAAQTAAELSKTMLFLADASRDLLHAYRLAKRGDVFGLSEFYRRYDYRARRRKPPYVRVANRWLQWRYAVQPLVWDFQDMLEEYFRSDMNPSVMRFTGKGEAKVANVFEEGSSYGLPYSKICDVTASCRYAAYVEISADSNTWKRLGLVNGLSLLWELTPGSFILDWWLPVGDYLSGLDACIGVTNVATYCTSKLKVEEHFIIGGADQVSRYESHQRTLSGIPSQPLPRLRTSDYDLKNRTLDALALLAQAVHGRRTRV